jgi:hypothetical protein
MNIGCNIIKEKEFQNNYLFLFHVFKIEYLAKTRSKIKINNEQMITEQPNEEHTVNECRSIEQWTQTKEFSELNLDLTEKSKKNSKDEKELNDILEKTRCLSGSVPARIRKNPGRNQRSRQVEVTYSHRWV